MMLSIAYYHDTKIETFDNWCPRMAKNSDFAHLVPLNTWITIFTRHVMSNSNGAFYSHLPSCKKSKTLTSL